MLVALGLAVGFATRGAVAGNRETIGVLHFVGAGDRFIAREFARHFFRLGLRGAALGGGLAVLAFLVAGAAAARLGGPGGASGTGGPLDPFALGVGGTAVIAGVALGTAVATGWTSRAIVLRHLRKLA